MGLELAEAGLQVHHGVLKCSPGVSQQNHVSLSIYIPRQLRHHQCRTALLCGSDVAAPRSELGPELLKALSNNNVAENDFLCRGTPVVTRRMLDASVAVAPSRTHTSRQAPESTVGQQPMAVCRQGIYVEYSVEYSKCRAMNGILV
eukprot:7800378-Pyramimonas_sp.AAC.1